MATLPALTQSRPLSAAPLICMYAEETRKNEHSCLCEILCAIKSLVLYGFFFFSPSYNIHRRVLLPHIKLGIHVYCYGRIRNVEIRIFNSV